MKATITKSLPSAATQILARSIAGLGPDPTERLPQPSRDLVEAVLAAPREHQVAFLKAVLAEQGWSDEEIKDEIKAIAAINPGQEPRIVGLPEVIETFRKWLYLPGPGPLYALAAAIVANYLEGDPVWLLLVAPPGCGKTEELSAASGLPNIHPTATLTEGALLVRHPKEGSSG